MVASASLRIDLRIRVRRQNVYRNFLIPHYVQPFTQILPVSYGQLHKQSFVNGRLSLGSEFCVSVIRETLQPEGNVSVGDLELDGCLIPHTLKTHDQAVVFPPYVISGEMGDFGGIGKLQFRSEERRVG